VLRRREPAAPWSCPGYPFTPLLYLAASLAVAVAAAIHDWKQALHGVLIVVAGAPVYAGIRWLSRPRPESGNAGA
jgi:hypothetical protein